MGFWRTLGQEVQGREGKGGHHHGLGVAGLRRVCLGRKAPYASIIMV